MLKKYIYLIINLVLLISGIIIVHTYAYNYVEKEVVQLEQKNSALDKMKNIYAIITNLQKIRGLHNINSKEAKLVDTINKLKKQNYTLASQIHNQKILAILKKHPNEATADFKTYTYDIEALLLLYKLTAYNAHLTLNSDIKEYLLSKTITNTLPYITEYFARIRGLASSVSKHKLDKDIKIKIKNQLYMIEELLKNTQEMQYFNNSYFTNELLASQQKEIKFIRNKLLNTDIIQSDGFEIFNTITKNINFLNKFYYKNMQELSLYYQNTIKQKNFIKSLIILICILSIVIVLSLNLFYFRKIQQYIQKIEHLNIIDPMTQLYNRRFLENFIDKFINQVQRQSEFFTVLMLDIDFFKKVNDTYGHDIGDKVIIAIAEVLQTNIRKSDLAIRYGGEEFMVLLHYADTKVAYTIAKKFQDAIEAIEFHGNNGEIFHKTLSIGIAEFPKNTDNIWNCIKLADEALYTAKTTGRNKTVIYTKK